MANRIYIQVDYQGDDAQKQIDQLNQKINAIGTNSVAATAQATKGVQSFSVAIDQARSHVDSLAQAITGMGVGEAIRQMIALGDTMNRIMAEMDQMTGGAEGVGKLRDAADALGMRFNNVAEAANRLRNAGMQMKDIVPVIQSIGAYSVIAGGNIQENFTRAIEGVATSWNKGFLTVKGLVDQMGTIGVHVMPILEKATNQTVEQVRSDVKSFAVGPLIKDIADGGAQYADAAKRIADNSPVAEFNRTQNAAQDLAMTLTKVLGPGIIQLLEAAKPLIDFLTAALEAFNKLPAPVKDLTVVLAGLAAAIWAVNAALAVTEALAGGGVFGAIAKGFTAATAAVAEFMAGAGEIVTIFGVGGAMATGLGEVFAVAAAIGAALFAAYEWFQKLEAAKQHKTFTPDAMSDQGPHQQPDLNALQKIQEQADNLLSEAQKRYASAAKEAIASVTAEYEEHFRTITEAAKKAHVDAADAILTVRKALELSIATEVRKNAEDLHKENVKALEESAVLARKLTVARASVVPDESFAGRVSIANVTADADEAQIKRQYEVREQERKDFTTTQIAALQEAAKAGTISEAAAVADIKTLRDNYLAYYVLQEKNAADAVAVHRLELDAKVNALLIEQHKQLQQELLQDTLTGIQQQQSLTTAYLTANKPDTIEERLTQIQKVEDAQIEAINKTHDAQIAAAQEELAYYVKLHPGGAGMAEETAKEGREEARINAQYQTQMQIDRIKAWEEGNEAIIAQQKEVYDQIRGLMGELFDAVVGKHKSMWAEIGDVIKKELLSAFKSVLTAQLAAQFTQALGFGSVGFKRSGLGMVPVFSGLGNAPQPAAVSSGVNFDVPDVINETLSAGPYMDANQMAPGRFGSQFRRFIQGGPAVTASEAATLAQVRARESSGNYAAQNQTSTASGAYQFTNGSWQMAAQATGQGREYPSAAAAPKSVQDANALWLLRKYGPNAPISWQASGPYDTGNRADFSTTVYAPADIPGYADGGAAAGSGAMSIDQMMNLPTRSYSALPGLITAGVFGGGPGGSSAPRGAAAGPGSVISAIQKQFGFLQSFGGSYAGSGGLSRVGTNIGQYRGAFNAPDATFGAKFQALSTGPLAGTPAGPAAGALGMMLASAGVFGEDRGSVAGVAEAAGGGFLAAGPIGAAIGASIGLGEMAAGVESPRREAVRLVKSLYHININNATADQIVSIANSSYGGRVSVAVRSSEVRRMIGLYAAGTAQANRFTTSVNDPHGASLVESGGGLYQQATYEYGNPYVQSSNLPTLGGVPATTLGAPGGLNLSLNIGGQDAAKFMTGQVVTPDVVSTQYAAAMSNSNGRVAQALMMSEPGSIAS